MKEKQLEALRAEFSSGDKSSPLMISTLSEWYDAKHRKVSCEEIAYINSLAITSCPYCGSPAIRRDGFKKSGLRCYECSSCGRKFSPVTNTIFDSRKIPFSEWIEYLSHLFEFHSVLTSSIDNRNAYSTGRYWLSKVFLVLQEYQDSIIFVGRVYADETYVPKWESKKVAKNGKELRGLSSNQYSIYSLTDGNKCYLKLEGVGKPSVPKVTKAYSSHISKGSTFVHDGENAHREFIRSLNLVSEVHVVDKSKKIEDRNNPLEPINKVHRYLKEFLSSHGGYSRDTLQDWLNLFAFIYNNKGNNYQKAQAFIEMAIKMHIKLRYSKWSNKENND
jgi:predicted RNA-binding Zn-ribbon protein involved in translation (DUF1610 family)